MENRLINYINIANPINSTFFIIQISVFYLEVRKNVEIRNKKPTLFLEIYYIEKLFL